MPLLKRVAAVAVALSLFVPGPAGAATPKKRARLAVHWLSHQQNPNGSFPGFSPIGSTADAIVSMAASRRSPADIAEALAYLEQNEGDVDSVGERAKVLMALEASGHDVRDFAGRDLVQELVDSRQPDGRLGDSTEVLNHALGMIALSMVGEDTSGLERDWLLAAQCGDGGWEFQDPAGPGSDRHCFDGSEFDFESDSDTTAYAVIALTGMKRWGPKARKNPFRFFKKRRDAIRRGWGYDRNYPLTNSNSTALVLEAYRSYGKNLPKGAARALRKLQYRLCGPRAGAFSFTYDKKGRRYRKQPPNVGATIGGILGLVARPYDAVEVSMPPPEPKNC